MPNDYLDPDYVPAFKGGMSLADLGKRPEPSKPPAPEAPPEDEQSAAAELLARLGV
jgi:hypothetical protein